MGYGLFVEGSSGGVQIDQDFSNKVIVGRGTYDYIGTLIGLDVPSYVSNVFITPLTMNKISATYGSKVWTVLWDFYYPSADLHFTTLDMAFNSYGALVGAGSPTGLFSYYDYILLADLDVYEAHLNSIGQTLKNIGYGLEVYKADGSLAFTSNAQYLKLSQKLVVPRGSINQDFSFTFPTPEHRYWIDVTQLDSYFKCHFKTASNIWINTGRSHSGDTFTLEKTILFADMP